MGDAAVFRMLPDPPVSMGLVRGSLTSLICLYVLIRSTDNLRSGAVAESRKVSGILLCRMAKSGMICEMREDQGVRCKLGF